MTRAPAAHAVPLRTVARACFAAIVILTLTLAGMPSAPAAQMGAKKDPRVRGELELVARKCGRRVEKKPNSDQTIGVGVSCLFFYQFDPADETDTSRDHGVVWIQTTFDAMNGYCARRVDSDVVLPEGVGPHSFAPPKKLETQQRKAMTVKLTTNAQGNSMLKGSVAQTFDLYPNSAAADVKELKNGKSRFRLEWTGATDKKLGFASGIQISWDVVAGLPSDFNFGVNYAIASSC